MALKAKEKTLRELRKFGITVSVPILAIGLFLWWKGSGAAIYIISSGLILVILGLIAPSALKYVEIYWMKFAVMMSFIMTRVILTIAFFIVITPFGLLLRVLGKDLLDIEIDKSRVSYWVPVEENGPQTRPDKPF